MPEQTVVIAARPAARGGREYAADIIYLENPASPYEELDYPTVTAAFGSLHVWWLELGHAKAMAGELWRGVEEERPLWKRVQLPREMPEFPIIEIDEVECAIHRLSSDGAERM